MLADKKESNKGRIYKKVWKKHKFAQNMKSKSVILLNTSLWDLSIGKKKEILQISQNSLPVLSWSLLRELNGMITDTSTFHQYITDQGQVNKKFPHHRFTCWVTFLQVVFEAKRQTYHNHINLTLIT